MTSQGQILARSPTVFSTEALSRILTEADRIVYDAQSLLDKAVATGEDELVEAARNNLRLVIENRDRLNKVFSLRLATANFTLDS
jgi:DNA polymerase III gamma/tau subunit